MHLVITDSGLGGLTVCAHIERALRQRPIPPAVDLTFVNAWPEQDRGYNSLPDVTARVRVFDRALRSMRAMNPDAIVIACNTLSILYESTELRRGAAVAVHGIVDAGVSLFERALRAHPGASLVLFGTRTTVESGVHRARLVERGIDAARITAVSCHGLATAIEQGPDSREVAALIDACARTAREAGAEGDPVLAGLCCTHYGIVAGAIRSAVAAHMGRTAIALDPNGVLVEEMIASIAGEGHGPAGRRKGVTVKVVSKVELNAAQRNGIGAIVEPVSPATARALHEYEHRPDLF